MAYSDQTMPFKKYDKWHSSQQTSGQLHLLMVEDKNEHIFNVLFNKRLKVNNN